MGDSGDRGRLKAHSNMGSPLRIVSCPTPVVVPKDEPIRYQAVVHPPGVKTHHKGAIPRLGAHQERKRSSASLPVTKLGLAELRHRNFVLGVPLYSDDPAVHDYVVQAKDAFEQTVLGLHQLARHGMRVEIRVVLHALTIPRLTALAEYIYRNLTFAEHVALMGLEHIGYAPRNMGTLWIDPHDYQDQLEAAVEILSTRRMNVSIYNHQLCVLRKSLWKFARKSISDWKNAYVEECENCGVREQCGGFFQWPTKLHSKFVHALPSTDSSVLGERTD